MGEMSKRERLQAVLAGKPADRLPVAFWRHWPIDDQEPEALAQVTLEYQRRFDWDFVKVTPSHTYCVDDYGAKHAYRGRLVGGRHAGGLGGGYPFARRCPRTGARRHRES